MMFVWIDAWHTLASETIPGHSFPWFPKATIRTSSGWYTGGASGDIVGSSPSSSSGKPRAFLEELRWIFFETREREGEFPHVILSSNTIKIILAAFECTVANCYHEVKSGLFQWSRVKWKSQISPSDSSPQQCNNALECIHYLLYMYMNIAHT